MADDADTSAGQVAIACLTVADARAAVPLRAASPGFLLGWSRHGPRGRFASGGNAYRRRAWVASGSMGMVDVAKGGMSGIRIDPCGNSDKS